MLFAEATNLPGVASNDPSALNHGLPSHLEFLIDPAGVSGGIYGTPAYTTTPATIKKLSATPSQLRPSFKTTVRAVLLVTLGIGLLQQANDPTDDAIRRFAAATFHLFVTTV